MYVLGFHHFQNLLVVNPAVPVNASLLDQVIDILVGQLVEPVLYQKPAKRDINDLAMEYSK